MKKLIFTLALSGLLFASCSHDDSNPKSETMQKEASVSKIGGGTPNEPQDPTEAQIKEAISETEYEAYLQVVNNETAGRGVKFCNHDSFASGSGSGYAQVTLNDGSVHYTYFKDSTGKTYVAGLYEGTSPPAGSGC